MDHRTFLGIFPAWANVEMLVVIKRSVGSNLVLIGCFALLFGQACGENLEAQRTSITATADPQIIDTTIDLAGSRQATWYLPAQTAQAWVLLQHGFVRSRTNLADLATHLMEAGLMVLAVDANMTGGNPSLASAFATEILAGTIEPPLGFALPGALILSGHSAGGLFVTHVAKKLVDASYPDLLGLLLLDPVEAGDSMGDNMQAVVDSARPVYAVLANASSCNDQNNAEPLLQELSAPFVGLKLIDRSRHTDAEGASTGFPLNWVCGNPLAHNIAWLQEFVVNWALDLANRTENPAYYPGGEVIADLLSRGQGVLLKEIATCGNGQVEDPEECDSQACCTDLCELAEANTVCRPDLGECDIREVCSGSDAACPADQVVPDGTPCSIGVCYQGQCSSRVTLLQETDLAGGRWSKQRFEIEVPQGAGEVLIEMAGEQGNADLYVRKGAKPSLWRFDCAPRDAGNNESCRFEGAGTYFIMLYGRSSYSSVSLTGSFLPQ